MFATTKRLNAKLRLYKDMGDTREYFVTQINEDKQFTFEPIIINGDVIAGCRVVFKKSSLTPNVFEFLKVKLSYTCYKWILLYSKQRLDEYNNFIMSIAKAQGDILKNIFKDGDYFEEK